QASDQNQVALASAQTLAASAVRTHLEQLGRVTQDNAVWDDAYEQLTRNYSPAWADKTFGASVWNNLTVKLQGAFFVDGNDRTRYGVWNGASTDHPASVYLGRIIRTLADSARGSPSAMSRIVIVNGFPKLVAVAAVRPTTRALDNPSQRRGVLIWV